MVQRALVWAVLDEGACKEDEFSPIFNLFERNSACSCYLISQEQQLRQERRKGYAIEVSSALVHHHNTTYLHPIQYESIDLITTKPNTFDYWRRLKCNFDGNEGGTLELERTECVLDKGKFIGIFRLEQMLEPSFRCIALVTLI